MFKSLKNIKFVYFIHIESIIIVSYGYTMCQKMVPAKMSVTKELVPDILHLVPVTDFVNFFQVKLVYSILTNEY